MGKFAGEAWQMLHDAFADWVEDKAAAQGAALAFYSVLSLAPLVVISLAVAGPFFDSKVASAHFLGQIQSLVGKDGAEAIGSILDNADQPRTGSLAAVLGMMTLLFALMFKLLPDAAVAWRDVWIGALITAVLFTVEKLLIGLYLGKSAIGSAYGAAGSLVVLLVWIYYSVQVLFLGAELAHQAERRVAQAKPAQKLAADVRAQPA
jgi:membrane protein